MTCIINLPASPVQNQIVRTEGDRADPPSARPVSAIGAQPPKGETAASRSLHLRRVLCHQVHVKPLVVRLNARACFGSKDEVQPGLSHSGRKPLCAKFPFCYEGLSLAVPPSMDNVRIFDSRPRLWPCLSTECYGSHTVVLCAGNPLAVTSLSHYVA